MSDYGGLAIRYVKPLFEVAQDKGELDGITADLARIDETLEQSPELRNFLHDPSVLRSSKQEAVELIFEGASTYVMNYMRLIIDKNRTEVINSTYRIFRKLIDKSRGITTGLVESAVKLDEKTYNAIRSKLEKRFKVKLDLDQQVVPDLLGGLRIRIGNTVIDGTVQGQLSRLRNTLAGMEG